MEDQTPIAAKHELQNHANSAPTTTDSNDTAMCVEFKTPQISSSGNEGNKNGSDTFQGGDSLTEKSSTVKISPTESLKQLPPLPYKEPSWSGLCPQTYNLEVIKNGIPVESLPLSTKPFWVFGRLPQCDVPMDHPSLSRYHAIIQFCTIPTETHPVGWYIYDLGSTHGTTVNKKLISPNVYHRIRVGYCIKFGGSTRLHILQGPDDDQESELSADAVAVLREKQKLLIAERSQEKPAGADRSADDGGEDKGCSWGMDDDEVEPDPEAVNPFALELPEELHLDDPKKTLRGWFEREGYDQPEYIVEEQTHGKFKCSVELPVDTPTGHPLRAEVVVQGKKKEAVVQCAMEACRMLDKQGLLRQAHHESRKRKAKNWEDNDFYDSDEDTFLDRTGDIEKKRQQRMQKAGKADEEKSTKALTYEELVGQLDLLESDMAEIQRKLDRSKQLQSENSANMDDLDAYMMTLKSGGLNATEKTKMKRQMIELKQKKARLEKMINVVKPQGLQEHRRLREEKRKQQEALQSSQNPVKVEGTQASASVKNANPHKYLPVQVQLEQPQVGIQKESPQVTTVTSPPSPAMTNKNLNESVNKSVKVDENTTESIRTRSDESHENKIQKDILSKSKTLKNDDCTEVKAKRKKSTSKTKESGVAATISDLKKEIEGKQVLDDEYYASWIPPKEQSGDGRTSLNDKLGY